jgi:hypothetical protein
MVSNEITSGAAAGAYSLTRTITVPLGHDESSRILLEVVVTAIDEHVNEELVSDTEGQTLLWLIAAFYMAMVAAFYTCVYFASEAYAALIVTNGP